MRIPKLQYDKNMIEPNAEKAPSNLCGVILAGNDGQVVQPLGTASRHASPPNGLIDGCSALERTYARAESLIPAQRLFTVSNPASASRPEIERQLRARPGGTVIVQPREKGTGLALLLALLHTNARHTNPSVALFPADNSSWQEDRLMRYVHLAYVIVRRHPSKIVMLAASLAEPVDNHGYIIPSAHWDITGWGTFAIKQVVEGTDRVGPHELARLGAFRNTMLSVFNSDFLFGSVQALRPKLARQLDNIRSAIGTPVERSVVAEVYDRLAPVNFTTDLLRPIVQMYPGSLVVLPMSGAARRWYANARTPLITPSDQQTRLRYARENRGDSGRSNGRPPSVVQ